MNKKFVRIVCLFMALLMILDLVITVVSYFLGLL